MKAEIGAIAKRFPSTILSDSDVVRYAAAVSVWGRWFIWLVTVVQFAYRPGFWYYEGHTEYLFLLVPVATLNGLVHYRLLTNRSVTWRWLLLLSAMDMVLATGGIVLQRGFEGFLFLAYYPALALFVVVPVIVARVGLDDYDRRRLYHRMFDGRPRSLLRCGR